ncbi:ATP-binding protein [Sphingomonas sp. S-NIH.Pt15_0812]|uniref:ATP-binding protein n=1 Tax=Sphingomonas sp. S-NIH.Pt15_0812 TaxID=1920129 RepID=UPI000F7E34CA|nr:ATP-binding protein [Sphingomonas sp. S-NIH.Pt15_0812]RSU47004.1 hypothetical protein BRX43_14655 [Sphingomonas sp. S-NIH.Pt15_0812]
MPLRIRSEHRPAALQRAMLPEVVADEAIAIVDADGRILHWSKGCERLFGWPADAAVGQHKRTLLHSRENGVVPPWPSARAMRRLNERCRDGHVLATIETVQPVGERAGGRVRAIWIGTDECVSGNAPWGASSPILTDPHQRAVIRSQTGLFDYDRWSGTIGWIDHQWQALPVPVGRVPLDRLCGVMDDPAALRRAVADAAADRRPLLTFECDLRLHQMRRRRVEAAAHMIYAQDGTLARMVGRYRDISEQHVRDNRRRRQRDDLHHILNSVPDAFLVTDAAGVILSANAAAGQLLEREPDALAGCDVAAVIGVQPAELPRLASAESPRPLAVAHADGQVINIELRVVLPDRSGEPSYALFIRDISDQVADAERMDLLRMEFVRTSQASALGAFAAQLTHEINQPLTALANFLGSAEVMLRKGGPVDRIADVLAMATGQALRAGSIVQRHFQRTVGAEPDMQPIDIAALVEEAVLLALPGNAGLDIALTYDLDDDARTIWGDRVQILQVLTNVLRNAAQALRRVDQSHRAILISARRRAAGDMIELLIADNGPGFTPALLPHLFEPLHDRCNDDRGGEAVGMGLGLSICRWMIAAHGGQIDAFNQPGGGACIRLTLPTPVTAGGHGEMHIRTENGAA